MSIVLNEIDFLKSQIKTLRIITNFGTFSFIKFLTNFWKCRSSLAIWQVELLKLGNVILANEQLVNTMIYQALSNF